MSALAAATLIRPLEFGFTPADFCPFKPEPTLIRDLVPPCKGLSGSERLVRIRAAEKGRFGSLYDGYRVAAAAAKVRLHRFGDDSGDPAPPAHHVHLQALRRSRRAHVLPHPRRDSLPPAGLLRGQDSQRRDTRRSSG